MKQYKSKFKDWGIEKNIKENDMRAIVRKDLKRKAEDPFRATIFRLRKRLIPTEKIERYKRDHGLVEGTIMSDGGTPISIVRGVVALANFLNVATPSDLNCEMPAPLLMDNRESSSEIEHQSLDLDDADMQSTNHPQAPATACEALTAMAVSLFEEIISRSPSPIVSPALTSLNLDEARGSMPPEDDANPSLDKKRYSLYVELLQPLMTQLRRHGLLCLLIRPNDSPADFYRHGFIDYTQEFRHFDDTPWTFIQPSTSTGSGLYASSSFEFWSSWLVSRLKVVYTKISIGGEGLRSYAGENGLVPLFAQVCSFMYGFDIENPRIRSCIGRSGLWLFFRQARVAFTCESYRAALGHRGCSCFMCSKLPKLLEFYNTIEAFQLYAVAEAFGHTVDHTCLKVFVERTKILPHDYSAIAKLHQRLATSWGIHWVYEPVSTDSNDS